MRMRKEVECFLIPAEALVDNCNRKFGLGRESYSLCILKCEFKSNHLICLSCLVLFLVIIYNYSFSAPQVLRRLLVWIGLRLALFICTYSIHKLIFLF